jgi:Ca2+-binding RTX toxin-like protein
VAGDIDGKADVFVKDVQTGEIALVSNSPDLDPLDDCTLSGLSADARYVVFTNTPHIVIDGDPDTVSRVYAKDLQTGVTGLVSAAADGTPANAQSSYYDMTPDGRYVLFGSSADNLVAGDANHAGDVFLKDILTGAVTCVSTDASGHASNGAASGASISADGRYVAFFSEASNLVPGDTNAEPDTFVKDLQTGDVMRVSTDSDGDQTGVLFGRISPDGKFVFFDTSSPLTADDTNNKNDVFIKPIGSDLRGTGKDDQFTGSFADDAISGRSGNDALTGAGGNDLILGGAGNDTLGGNAGADRLLGESGNDTIAGGADVDRLYGGAGNDRLDGGGSRDWLYGGTGNDALAGGAGPDFFVYVAGTPGGLGSDKITDFIDGADKIRLVGYTAAQVRIDLAHDTVSLADGTKITLVNFTGTLDASDILMF